MKPPITPQAMVSAFAEHSAERPKLFRAPGRVNIIGEHTDYNDGLVLPTATAIYTWLAIAPRADRMLRVHSRTLESTRTFGLDDIQRGVAGDWCEYVKGVACLLRGESYELGGADIVIDGEIPIGGGLSSSASLEIATALAILDAADAAIEPERLAALCQRAESEFVGVSCGIMDQYAIACGRSGCAMKLDCRSLGFERIEIPVRARLLVVDSGVHHELPDGGYNARTRECQEAVRILGTEVPGLRSLRDLGLDQLEKSRGALGDALYRRCRHVLTEIQRVEDACEALRSGDLEGLGALINSSHASLRDDYEVSCGELDRLVEIASDCAGVYGSRMVGAGFGGCALSLVADEQLEPAIRRISSEYGRELGREPWVHVVAPSGPAGAVPTDSSRS